MENILIESRTETINRSVDIWKNSEFHFLPRLSSDERGYWGEDYFHRYVKEYTNLLVKWDGDSNIEQEDGIYDMKVNSLRSEVKTAMKGTKSDTWQHDQIKEDDDYYDRLVFLDLKPNNTIHITVIKNNEMVYGTRHPIFEKTSTPCKGGWKFDMSNATLRKGLAAGLTYLHDLKNPNGAEVSKFLVRHFS